MLLRFETFNLVNATYSILFYTTVSYWLTIKFKKFSILRNLCWTGIISANSFIFFVLLFRWLRDSYFPLSNLYESLLFLTWALLFVLIFIERKTSTKLFGALIVPVMTLIITFANLVLPSSMQEAAPLVPALQSNWLMMHVSMMMLSYATLITGSLLSILFLALQNIYKVELPFHFSALRTSTLANSTLLKLLSSIDLWSYRIIGIGFPFLTIGIIAGAVWADEAWGSYWSWDPKETWALITWLVFAAYIHARLTKGWDGRRAAWLGSLGFIVVWICYLGVNFLGQGLHSYGFLS